jgi:hypothetical protein
MVKHLATLIMFSLLILPARTLADKDSGGASISDFKAQSLYRAVKLNWKVKIPFKKEVFFQLLRSDKRKRKYTYLDKSLGSESKYYYKLIVKGAEETYGPVAARPYFSPPAT